MYFLFCAALLLLSYVAASTLLLKRRQHAIPLPPSPPTLPIIGHLHLIRKLPHQSMMELSAIYGELMFLFLGAVPCLVVSSPKAARQILRTNERTFASRSYTFESEYIGYKGAGLVFAPYGDHWRLARKLCTLELLTSRRVESAEPARKLEMALLLSDLYTAAVNDRDPSTVNLSSKLSDFTFNNMLRMVVNKSFSRTAKSQTERLQALDLKDAILEMFRVANGIHLASFAPWLKWLDPQVYKIRSVYKRLNSILQGEIEQHRLSFRRGDTPNDFIDVMLSLDESLSDTVMKALCQDMIGGGTDTAANTVEWALSELVRNPGAMRSAQEELDKVIGKQRALQESDVLRLSYLQAVVSETLRLHPAITLIPRENTSEACEVDGYVIPARTRVFVNVYAIGRDKCVWKDPVEFEPRRFERNNVDVRGQSFELVPFGSGRRMCPGMQLGLTMVTFMLGSLLHAFDWEVPGGKELEMEEHFGLTVARASPLVLKPSVRLMKEAYLLP